MKRFWRRPKRSPVSWEPEHGMLWVGLSRKRGSGPSEVIADASHTLLFSRDHPEREGEVSTAFSFVTVVCDYDEDDNLYGVELIGVPATRAEARGLLRVVALHTEPATSGRLPEVEVVEVVDEQRGE